MNDLKARRQAAGITQQELAARAGLSLAYIQLLEGGYDKISEDAVKAINDGFEARPCPHCDGKGYV